MLIGRRDPHKDINPDIDLSSIDTTNSMSRIHAEIKQATGGFYIEDKGSMNGTFVNGRKLKPGQRIALKPSDRCKLSDVEFCFTGQNIIRVA